MINLNVHVTVYIVDVIIAGQPTRKRQDVDALMQEARQLLDQTGTVKVTRQKC